MIKKLYIDNYKCLVNFELQFSNMNLIFGTNGSGKSTLFSTLRDIRDFVTGKRPISIFSNSTLTSWQKRDVQTFELEIEGNNGTYNYRLEIEHELDVEKQRVCLEHIAYDGKPIYHSKLGEVRLYRDDYSEGPEFSGDWSQSGFAFLSERAENTKISWLKKWFREQLHCLQIDPLNMKAMAGVSENELDYNAHNFVGWYRHNVATNMEATISLYNALKDMYDDFRGFSLEQQGGDVQHLFANVGVTQETKGKPEYVKYSFADLSDGERCLIVLYTLLQLTSDSETTLCLDEPDNFIALRELHPWFIELEKQVCSNSCQALIISHHPEIVDYMARDYGLILNRDQNGPTRVRKFPKDESELLPSEIMSRGWNE